MKSRIIWSCFVFLCLSAAPLTAEQFGLFTYIVDGAEVTITDYPEDATGVVVIPAEIDSKPVTEIRSYAFRDCTGLTSVTIPDSVIEIGDRAFQGCTSLDSVTIPDSVTVIGLFAFAICTELTSVTIPQSVITITAGAFRGCTSLTSFEVDSLNPSYSSPGDVLFNKTATVLLDYPEGRFGDYAIPDGVATIAGTAFLACTGLTSVTIPDDVTTISTIAFQGCTSLTSVTIPDSVTTIGDGAFDKCTSLTSVTIPDGVTTIGVYAFRECTGLTSISIPDSVTTISNVAFEGCTGLAYAIFLGDVPSNSDLDPFDNTSADFTIFYLNGSTGFATTWFGHPTIRLDQVPTHDLSPISSVSSIPTGTRFTIAGVIGRNIGVEYSPDMSPGSWIELGNFSLSNSDGAWAFIDPDSVRRARNSGYYRAFLRPKSP